MQKTHANHVKSRLDGHFGSSDGFEKRPIAQIAG